MEITIGMSLPEVQQCPLEHHLPPKVNGTREYTLSIKGTDFQLDCEDGSNSYMLTCRFWGRDDPVCIPLSEGDGGYGHLESTLISIDCSRTCFCQYWRDSQFVYVDVVSKDSFRSVGFGSIETPSVDLDFDTLGSIDVRVPLYSNDTGFRTGCVTLSFCILPQPSVPSPPSMHAL
ncbi:hypothetical protein WA556_000025 [Blastocystis sp. ATCC 50177/Nand II]